MAGKGRDLESPVGAWLWWALPLRAALGRRGKEEGGWKGRGLEWRGRGWAVLEGVVGAGAVLASVDSWGAVTTMCSGPTARAGLPGRRLGVSNH